MGKMNSILKLGLVEFPLNRGGFAPRVGPVAITITMDSGTDLDDIK
jgi:hypothetical protein